VSDLEIEALAQRLDLSADEFRRVYTRTLRGGDVSLRERRNYDCVLYEPGIGCSVYEDRPRQCRTYPFWRVNLHSKESWDAEAELCPGIGDGEVWGDDRLLPLLTDDGVTRDR
jgi:Fe-S-cluster containining protein